MRKFSTKLAVVLLTISVGTIAQAQELYVAGPARQLANDGSLLTILGQPVAVEASTKFFISGRKVSASRFLREVSSEGFVYAELLERAGKFEAKNLLIVNNPYVAGATTVYVGGKITSFEGSVGRVRISNVEVDVTTLAPDVIARLNVGDVVEASGIQPSAYNPVLTTSFRISKDVTADTLGISGSGVTAQGISGSGISAQGISGSGVSAQGISGSGISTQGISGSGKTVQGTSGSGISAQGISGSGVSALGISGSGISTQGISGSGVTAQGISGSGVSAQGISGSG